MVWNSVDLSCAQGVHPLTMQLVIGVESGGNPFAVGVVGDRLVRQPQSSAEAVATVNALEQAGRNYSVGLAQVNRIHFVRFGWNSDIARAFDVCANLRAASQVLRDCYGLALRRGRSAGDPALKASLSCYFSGDLHRGEALGYVARVLGPSSIGGASTTVESSPRASMLVPAR